jgi:hypothetical protein
MELKFTGTLASAVTFVVPSNKKMYRLDHAGTSHTVTVKVSGQTGVVLNPGDKRLVYCNGTDIVVADSYIANAAQVVTAPSSHSSTGTAGQLAVDDSGSPPVPHLYICYATNLWAQIALDGSGFSVIF